MTQARWPIEGGHTGEHVRQKWLIAVGEHHEHLERPEALAAELAVDTAEASIEIDVREPENEPRRVKFGEAEAEALAHLFSRLGHGGQRIAHALLDAAHLIRKAQHTVRKAEHAADPSKDHPGEEPVRTKIADILAYDRDYQAQQAALVAEHNANPIPDTE